MVEHGVRERESSGRSHREQQQRNNRGQGNDFEQHAANRSEHTGGTGTRQPHHTQHRHRRGGRGGDCARHRLRHARGEQERRFTEGLQEQPGGDRRGRRHRSAVDGVHQAGRAAGRVRADQGLPGLHERESGTGAGRPRHERVPASALFGQLQRAEQAKPAAARRRRHLPARRLLRVRQGRQAEVHRHQGPAGWLHRRHSERRDEPGSCNRRAQGRRRRHAERRLDGVHDPAGHR